MRNKEKPKMHDTVKRAIISVAVFVGIYFVSLMIGVTSREVRFLGTVIGTGCYWIGSNKR